MKANKGFTTQTMLKTRITYSIECLQFLLQRIDYCIGEHVLGTRLARKLNFVVAPNIYGSEYGPPLHVIGQALRILKWLLDIWKICALLD